MSLHLRVLLGVHDLLESELDHLEGEGGGDAVHQEEAVPGLYGKLPHRGKLLSNIIVNFKDIDNAPHHHHWCRENLLLVWNFQSKTSLR